MSHIKETNFSSRLRQRREQLGIRKHDLASSIGVSLTTIQQYENGQIPRGELAVRLAEVLDCSLDWLLAGRGQDNSTQNSFEDRLILVPLVESRFNSIENNFKHCQKTHALAFRWDFLQSKGNPESMVLLQITGDSMAPTILNNDLVLIDQSQSTTMPGHIYAVCIENMIYLKVINALPGKLLLSSINPEYAPIEINETEQSNIRIIGKAIWLGRELS